MYFMEVPAGIAPAYGGFADPCLTAWRRHQRTRVYREERVRARDGGEDLGTRTLDFEEIFIVEVSTLKLYKFRKIF